MSENSKLSKTIVEKEDKLYETFTCEQKKIYKEIIFLMNKRTYLMLKESFDEGVEVSAKMLLGLFGED